MAVRSKAHSGSDKCTVLGFNLAPSDVDSLESQLAARTDNMDARAKLFAYYAVSRYRAPKSSRAVGGDGSLDH